LRLFTSKSLRRETALSGHFGQILPGKPFDGVHPIDVRATQAEHARRARHGRNRSQFGLHALEDGAVHFRAQIAQRQTVQRGRHRVDDGSRDGSIRKNVLACLVEELKGHRHMPRVHVLHLRHVADVRNALGRAGGD
jgi:hypothetical protein